MKLCAPEARFVLLAACEADAAPRDSLRAAAASVTDWDAAVRMAREHRLSAYLRDACARGAIAPPDSATATLRADIRARVAQTLLLNAELARLARAFAETQLPLIVLKGPALARTLYDRADQRPYGDIDLLVREQDEARAVELLHQRGFTEARYAAEAARQAQTHHVHDEGAYHRLFLSDATGALVELHTDPLQLGLRPRCESARWRRAVPAPGLPGVRMFCTADQLVHLAVHGHKHGFEQVIWLKDIDLLLRRQRDAIDWRLVAATAQAEGVTGSVWLAIDLTRRLLATPVDDEALRALRPAPPLRAMLRAVWPADEIGALEGRMRRRAVQFHAAESWRGMLPSLLVMGRRRDRIGAIVESVLGSRWPVAGRLRRLPAAGRVR